MTRDGENDGRPELLRSPDPLREATLWWHTQQPPPLCPTCRTFCRCRRTALKENMRVQWRYCQTCDYRIKMIVPVK
jgi:hypothetical protein